MKYKNFAYLFTASLIFLFLSCASKKDYIYFQHTNEIPDVARQHDMANYELKIIPNDNLLITVSALNPQAAEPFNAINLDRGLTSNIEWQGYLVDESGNINFPIIGKVHLAGLTKDEAILSIEKKVSEYIENPVINIRFLNYKVSILGEVKAPGAYIIKDEKVTLPEALALAGDMTIYGNRHDVMLCRVVNGEKQFHLIDMTSPEVFFSPYYYLQQNDIVYVQPTSSRVRNSDFNPYISIFISSVSLILTAVTLFTK